MAANKCTYDLGGRILLQASRFMSGPSALAVSTLVPTGSGSDTGIASTVPTPPPGTGLATANDGDISGCAEASGPASSHQPFPTPIAVTIH